MEEDGAFDAEELGIGVLAEDCPYPPVDELILALSEEAPDRVPDLMALLQLENELPKYLTEGLAEAPVSTPQVDISPAGRAIWKAVETSALDAIRSWPNGKRLEILLVGAPPASIVERICNEPGLTRLTITDAEDTVVEGAKQRIRPEPLLRIDPFEDVVPKAAYDVILFGDGLSRLGGDQLGVASSTLAAGGLFLAVEPAPDLLSDLRNGVSADWWTETVTSEAPIGRRKAAEEWVDVLTEDRMEAVGVVTLNDPSVEASLILSLIHI